MKLSLSWIQVRNKQINNKYVQWLMITDVDAMYQNEIILYLIL